MFSEFRKEISRLHASCLHVFHSVRIEPQFRLRILDPGVVFRERPHERFDVLQRLRRKRDVVCHTLQDYGRIDVRGGFRNSEHVFLNSQVQVIIGIPYDVILIHHDERVVHCGGVVYSSGVSVRSVGTYGNVYEIPVFAPISYLSRFEGPNERIASGIAVSRDDHDLSAYRSRESFRERLHRVFSYVQDGECFGRYVESDDPPNFVSFHDPSEVYDLVGRIRHRHGFRYRRPVVFDEFQSFGYGIVRLDYRISQTCRFRRFESQENLSADYRGIYLAGNACFEEVAVYEGFHEVQIEFAYFVGDFVYRSSEHVDVSADDLHRESGDSHRIVRRYGEIGKIHPCDSRRIDHVRVSSVRPHHRRSGRNERKIRFRLHQVKPVSVSGSGNETGNVLYRSRRVHFHDVPSFSCGCGHSQTFDGVFYERGGKVSLTVSPQEYRH